jgi:hypothetical protein
MIDKTTKSLPPEGGKLFVLQLILIQVAIYMLYNLSHVYAQMNAIILIKNPSSVTA